MAPPKLKSRPSKKVSPKSNKEKPSTQPQSTSSIPLELQQLLLNIFKNSFSESLESDIKPLLQEIKGHLYNRDFSLAFGKNEYLEAYAARWSPSRSLGYLQLFDNLIEHIAIEWSSKTQEENKNWKVVCLGGGAGAEIVALGGFTKLKNSKEERGMGKLRRMEVVAIDIADWTQVFEKLTSHLVVAPPLSRYASAAAQAANTPLIEPEEMEFAFHQHDILNTDFVTISPLFVDARLITLMFTLNELYSTSLSLTQKFLLNLTSCLSPGSHLLVVDSPGSYSTLSLNGAEKKYPMQWLLDHTLLKEGMKGEQAAWSKINDEESRWFRLDPGLRYPIELENMRFQLHLYQRMG